MKMIFLILMFNTLLNTNAETLLLKKDQGSVTFKAKGRPSLISILGNGGGIEGQIKVAEFELEGELIFEVKSLSTGIELRDEHMKDKYLEVSKFPTAKISFAKTSFNKNEQSIFNANLELHGVKKTISGKFKINETKDKLEANFIIDLREFNIIIPEYLGITLSSDIEISIQSAMSKRVEQI